MGQNRGEEPLPPKPHSKVTTMLKNRFKKLLIPALQKNQFKTIHNDQKGRAHRDKNKQQQSWCNTKENFQSRKIVGQFKVGSFALMETRHLPRRNKTRKYKAPRGKQDEEAAKHSVQ